MRSQSTPKGGGHSPENEPAPVLEASRAGSGQAQPGSCQPRPPLGHFGRSRCPRPPGTLPVPPSGQCHMPLACSGRPRQLQTLPPRLLGKPRGAASSQNNLTPVPRHLGGRGAGTRSCERHRALGGAGAGTGPWVGDGDGEGHGDRAMARETKRGMGARGGAWECGPDGGGGRDGRARTQDRAAPAPSEGSLPRTPQARPASRGVWPAGRLTRGWVRPGGPCRYVVPLERPGPQEPHLTGLGPTGPRRTRRTHPYFPRGEPTARGGRVACLRTTAHEQQARTWPAGSLPALGHPRHTHRPSWQAGPDTTFFPALVPRGLGTAL